MYCSRAGWKIFCLTVCLLVGGQSLYGHSSGIDSVTFDASEGLVAAGAASGTIKLWDLEEAKGKKLLFSFSVSQPHSALIFY